MSRDIVNTKLELVAALAKNAAANKSWWADEMASDIARMQRLLEEASREVSNYIGADR